MSGADGRLVIAARAGVAAADAGGMLSVRIHALDGRAVLTRHMKLGLDGEAEGGRWQSALQMQTIFEASRKWRLPFVLAPIVLAWLVGMLLRCHKKRRTVSGKTD
uniref:Uncharacterized protein n=1 Tax=Chrysotila carterae TaxID=13221 RepID=A0A7S4BNP1_CHRCT